MHEKSIRITIIEALSVIVLLILFGFFGTKLIDSLCPGLNLMGCENDTLFGILTFILLNCKVAIALFRSFRICLKCFHKT